MSSCTSASDSDRCRSLPIVNSPSRWERRWVAKCSLYQMASSISAARSGSMSPGMQTWTSLVAVIHLYALRAVALERGQVGVGETLP